MSLAARVSLVTLGVAEPARARQFYESLGWEVAATADDGFCLFRTAGALLALYPDAALAADAGVAEPEPVSFRGVALAINLEDEAAVDAGLARAVEAGGTLLHAAHRADWGGYSGYVADPDGHAWEIAFNPGWPLGDDGLPVVD